MKSHRRRKGTNTKRTRSRTRSLITWHATLALLVVCGTAITPADPVSATCPSFGDPDTLARASGAFGIATADFDGDSIPDLGVTARIANEFLVLLGRGDGTFEDARRFASGVDPRWFAAGDLDNDGIVDVAITNSFAGSDTIQILWGGGSGSWDGSYERVAMGGVGDEPTGIAIADLDGDAWPDLVVTARGSNEVVPLIGTGSGHDAGAFVPGPRAPTGARPGAVAAADLDGNGLTDLVTADTDADTVSVFLATAPGGIFAPRVPYTAGDTPTYVIVEDLDGDAAPDVVTSNALSNDVSVWLGITDAGNPTGALAPAVSYFVGDSVHTNSRSVAAIDLTGDGVRDLVTTNAHTDNVSILVGNGPPGQGDGTFQATRNFPLGSYPREVAARDFNGDGLRDLAVTDDFDGTVLLLVNTCDLVPIEVSEATATRGRFGVHLRFRISGSSGCMLRIDRTPMGGPRAFVAERSCDEAGVDQSVVEIDDVDAPPGRILYEVFEQRASSDEVRVAAVWAPAAPGPVARARLAPNPGSGILRLVDGEIGTGSALVRVFDATGRLLVQRVVEPSLGAVWDGRDSAGTPVPAGAYVVTIERGDLTRSFSVRIVR